MGRKDKDGYGIFWNKKYVKAHRFSVEIYQSEIPEDMLCCHKCHNPSCVNPEHIYIGTHQDNMRDRDERYRQLKLNDVKLT